LGVFLVSFFRKVLEWLEDLGTSGVANALFVCTWCKKKFIKKGCKARSYFLRMIDFLAMFEERPYCRTCVEIERSRQKRKAEERAASRNPVAASTGRLSEAVLTH
jgi:hypothetical protein